MVKRVAVCAVAGLLCVQASGQVSTEEAQQRLQERQRLAAVAATQPAALVEENQRLKSEVASLHEQIAKLRADLDAARKPVATAKAPAITTAPAPALVISNGMTLAEVQGKLHDHGSVKSQVGSITTYEFVQVGGVTQVGQANRPRLVQNPDTVFTVDFVDGKVVAWSVRKR